MALALLAGTVPGIAQSSLERLTVMLDFFANPNHVPLYAAQSEKFFADQGLDVDIQIPADPSDPPKLAAAGRVDLAITTSLDLVITHAAGLKLTAVGSLIQHPLGGLMVLKSSGIKTLADLKGKKIGFSLEPEEPVLWTAMLATVGLQPGDFQLINVGFNTVTALLAGQVDAIGAFRNFEPIQLALMGHQTVFFPFEEHGIPDTWQLVFVASEATLQTKSELIRKFFVALAEAISFTLRDPNRTLDDFFAVNGDLAALDQRELNIRSMLATLLLFQGAPCDNDPAKWTGLQSFLFEKGLIAQQSQLAQLFIPALLPSQCGAQSG
jgi:putative hydroxymethylpyrimidine transport system substrate-binding protein